MARRLTAITVKRMLPSTRHISPAGRKVTKERQSTTNYHILPSHKKTLTHTISYRRHTLSFSGWPAGRRVRFLWVRFLWVSTSDRWVRLPPPYHSSCSTSRMTAETPVQGLTARRAMISHSANVAWMQKNAHEVLSSLTDKEVIEWNEDHPAAYSPTRRPEDYGTLTLNG